MWGFQAQGGDGDGGGGGGGGGGGCILGCIYVVFCTVQYTWFSSQLVLLASLGEGGGRKIACYWSKHKVYISRCFFFVTRCAANPILSFLF